MSTTVLIDLAHLTGTATNGASTGMVEVHYSKRIEPADPASQIVVVRSFAVQLDATGKASVVVPPSEVDGFYTWAERVEGGITRYTSVPDVPTVNYRTLVDVDPATFDPTVDATAAWYLALAARKLGDLADVDTTDLADGFTLVWEAASSTWKVGAGGAGASALADLTDVDLTDLADGDALVWDATAGTWVRVPLSSTYVAQADPEAVAGLAPITDGAGGYSWEPGGGGGGTTDHGLLNGLLDDDHTQYALADGTRGMFAATSHTHPASQISDSTVTGRALITAATATAARTAISAAPALGSDDNYVTDAEKAALHSHANKSALDQVSGINTGDQVLPTWSTIDGKPAVVAAGATQADARAAIGAGTSSLVIGTTAGTAKAGDYAPDLSGLAPIAQPRNAQTGTAYTLVASDAGKLVTLDNAAAITVTVPASTITVPADTVVRVDFLVLGTGLPTFVGSGGMTINADPSLVADAQYAGLSLLLLSATSGVLVGRLATP